MSKVFIIAEAGVNHNGSIELAKKLIDIAVKSGADAVKFQTFKTENMVSRYALKADYQQKNTENHENQFEMLKKLELNSDTYPELMFYCKKRGIIFLSSPFDHESIELLSKLGLKVFKIPSGEITNLPYLKHIGSLKKQVILSTGMADLSEIKNALDILISSGTTKENITVLHCNTAYPTPYEDVNLLAMLTIRDTFKIKVGYSDHTLGIEVPIAAAALGASMIEKHFTLDKTLPGPDHKISLEPEELKSMVRSVRNIEKALGTGEKKSSVSEEKNRIAVRKSIVAAKSIKKGEVFTEDNIGIKRPGTGISPMKWEQILDEIAQKDYKKDEII